MKVSLPFYGDSKIPIHGRVKRDLEVHSLADSIVG
jgi:hypothetical protein